MMESDNPLIKRGPPTAEELAAAYAGLAAALENEPPPQAGAPAEPRPGPRAGWRKVNWGEAARLLAGGASIEVAAAALGCEPQRLERNLRRSAKFRHRIDRMHARLRLTARLRFAALGDEATRQMEHYATKLDSRLLQWVGDRLQLAETGTFSTADELAGAVEAMPRKFSKSAAKPGLNGI